MSGLLRICTAGSVDDGKSTLIGRLLYDSQGIYEDQVHSVKVASKNRTAGPVDFSLFTDGLRAEREQGITIDVAYRYFATAHRKFILADTPGHQQYTRNMATGASTADLAVLLVDARYGLLEQSRRHAQIAQLLGISRYVVAVNKMDLVDFSREIFDSISNDFSELLQGNKVHTIPISALKGDNVTTQSERTPWYEGPSLLTYLETIEVGEDLTVKPFRFPIQLVVRPSHDFRGYAGQIESGVIHRGDTVTLWPSGATTTVVQIVTYDGELEEAHAPMAVTLVLSDALDISRGDMLSIGTANVGKHFDADVVWMDERPSDPKRIYLLKHTTRTVRSEVDCVLSLNDIGQAAISTSQPLFFDQYRDNRSTGSFILIDPATNFTAGAGMINGVRHDADVMERENIAAQLAKLARAAESDDAAAQAMREALDKLLS